MTCRSDYDRRRYLANHDEMLARRLEYYYEYQKKGLRKPRKPRQPRSRRDHERYMEKRDEILANQKEYRDTHKWEIREKRRRRIERERRAIMTKELWTKRATICRK